MTTSRLVIIRHGDVDARWKGICYGQQDVELCGQWIQGADTLIAQIAALKPDRIYHSGLQRTRWLAEQIAGQMQQVMPGSPSIAPVSDVRLRERNFGNWEGKSWDEAYQSDPEHFHDLIHKPDRYRPPFGETTTEMQMRVVEWYQSLPKVSGELSLAIAHSGPIAALAGFLQGLPATNWENWMLRTGEAIVIEHSHEDTTKVQVRRGLP